jgi:hypothetical protein
MAEILIEGSRKEYSTCGDGHKLIRNVDEAQRLINADLRSAREELILSGLHQSGHQDVSLKGLLPAAREQLALLTDLSREVGTLKLGERGLVLLGRSVFTASRIVGKDMATEDVDNVRKIFFDFLDARGTAEGTERSKADIAAITAFSLGESGNGEELNRFMNEVYSDARLGLNTEKKENCSSSEVRKLLLYAIAYRPALNQLILDALDFGDVDEVCIAVGRIDEFATLLRENPGSISPSNREWSEVFAQALRQRMELLPGRGEVVNPLTTYTVSLANLAQLLELSVT